MQRRSAAHRSTSHNDLLYGVRLLSTQEINRCIKYGHSFFDLERFAGEAEAQDT